MLQFFPPRKLSGKRHIYHIMPPCSHEVKAPCEKSPTHVYPDSGGECGGAKVTPQAIKTESVYETPNIRCPTENRTCRSSHTVPP